MVRSARKVPETMKSYKKFLTEFTNKTPTGWVIGGQKVDTAMCTRVLLMLSEIESAGVRS